MMVKAPRIAGRFFYMPNALLSVLTILTVVYFLNTIIFLGKMVKLMRLRFIFLAAVFLVFTADTSAQEVLAVNSLPTSELVDRAKDLLKENQPQELIPVLYELLVRIEGNTDKDSLETRSFCLFQIAASQMQLERFEDAQETLDLFLGEFPKDAMASRAAIMITECYAISGDWAAAEKYARDVLTDSKLDLQRKLSTLQLLSEALVNQEKWQEAIDPLSRIRQLAEEDSVRNRATAMQLTVLGQAGRFDEFIDLIGSSPDEVLLDPRVNAGLIAAGDQQRKGGHSAVALMLYRKVLPRQEMIQRHQAGLQVMEAELAEEYRPTVGSSRSAFDEKQAVIRRRYERKQSVLEELRGQDGYETELQFRMGQCYVDMKRNWPAWTLFRKLYLSAPDHELAEDARFQAFAVTLDMQRWGDAEKEARDYLETYRSGRFSDEVSLNLVQLLLQNGKLEAAGSVAVDAVASYPKHRFMDQLKYLLGYIYFQQLEYRPALQLFTEVSEAWPDSMYHDAAGYWLAMCKLFLGQYTEAVVAFEEYLSGDNEQKPFAEDASYRLGVAHYGAGDFDAAEAVFMQFIKDWPSSDLYSEACSMAGDLRGADGDLKTALEFYQLARGKAVNISQINYAIFQSAKVYELQGDWPAVVDMMEEYLLSHGDAGNYAGAGFWIGKAWSAMGDDDKALETYLDTVVRFGNKPDNSDVDLILRELIKKYNEGMTPELQSLLKDRLRVALNRAVGEKRSTLILRLQTLFAEISEGAERRRYVDQILSSADIQDAGALTLLLMAVEAAERGDSERVHAVYLHCMETYEESEILADVMNTELQMLVRRKLYADAAELAEQITNRFGYTDTVGLTRKLKADALRLGGNLDAAVETYKELFAVREWRGELTPESLYWIGVCRQEQGDSREAFAYFQRVYVLYEGYTEWVARAYERSLDCLEALGHTGEIIKTCREMLANEAVAARPEGRRARARLEKLNVPIEEAQ